MILSLISTEKQVNKQKCGDSWENVGDLSAVQVAKKMQEMKALLLPSISLALQADSFNR